MTIRRRDLYCKTFHSSIRNFSLKQTYSTSLFLVHFGALPFSDYFTPLKNPCKLLTYKGLCIEAEGTRTLNLRIDSPMKQCSKGSKDKDLAESDNTAYKPAYKDHSKGTSKQGNLCPTELQEIINCWDELPEHVRQTIQMLVDAAGEKAD